MRHPTARHIRLSLDPASGRAKLILPRRAALKAALAWAEGKTGWLAAQRESLPRAQPFAPGLTMTVADDPLTIEWRAGSSRRVVRDSDALRLSGPIETLPRRVEAWLRREALDRLAAETQEFAILADVAVAKVAVGDPRSRWGSCASSGVIRYSWRLILAPGWVRRATVAHEVAHRVHMNHGAAFHALVADLLGTDPTPARHWLRTNGTALHWLGRSS
ncbi:M48 family metallopeptidase [Sphingomonas sp. Tas61C01]|uniref:M48 family metallopeptidase n=1 Tax=Sphingomonas sp. Tas61C01 TaxID=3458297 RepID=UPI00403EECCF